MVVSSLVILGDQQLFVFLIYSCLICNKLNFTVQIKLVVVVVEENTASAVKGKQTAQVILLWQCGILLSFL